MCIAIGNAISRVFVTSELIKTHTFFASLQERKRGLNINNEIENCFYHPVCCLSNGGVNC